LRYRFDPYLSAMAALGSVRSVDSMETCKPDHRAVRPRRSPGSCPHLGRPDGVRNADRRSRLHHRSHGSPTT
jgi:hypothetical protein